MNTSSGLLVLGGSLLGSLLWYARAHKNQANPSDKARAATGRWVSVVPILPARSIENSTDFYCTVLGFELVHRADNYGIVRRDDVQIHFWGPSSIEPSKSDTMVRVGVWDIEAVLAAVEPHGIVHENAPLHTTEWGTREFAVRDCDGHLITFFESVRPQSDTAA